MTKPIYIQICDDIKNLIEKKELLSGQVLPSEKTLMKKYNCSRHTVRKSTGILEQKGYIIKKKGAKSVVADSIRYNFPFSSIESFKEVSSNMKSESFTKLVSIDYISKNDLDFLRDFSSDKVLRLRRIRNVDGQNVVFDEDYFDTNLVDNITKEIAEDSVYQYIEAVLGLEISFSKKSIEVQEVENFVSEKMKLKKNDTMVVVKSYTYLKDLTLFQYTISYHRAERFKFETYAKRNK